MREAIGEEQKLSTHLKDAILRSNKWCHWDDSNPDAERSIQAMCWKRKEVIAPDLPSMPPDKRYFIISTRESYPTKVKNHCYRVERPSWHAKIGCDKTPDTCDKGGEC